MAPPREDRDTLLSSLPKPWPGDLRTQIKHRISDPSTDSSKGARYLVILDDDPTGTQTCHDIQVLMTWDIGTLKASFTSSTTQRAGGFFILTNSRALHPHEVRRLLTVLCHNLKEAAADLGLEFDVVLRSDSTLRGHFPLEADVVADVLGRPDLWLLAPFFLQGGRYTIHDVHYVDEEGTLVPAGETQFAGDATFGYRNSNLKDWVEEKSAGSISRDGVQSLSVEDIRTGGPSKVCELLLGFPEGSCVVVNAASESDMDVVVMGVLDASESRKIFFRSGAALVSSRLGITPIPPKTSQQLQLDPSVGGLIIAGSYVPKTTAQLETLISKSESKLTTITLEVDELLKSSDDAENAIRQAQDKASSGIESGLDVLVMTSRKLVTGKDGAESLDIGSTVAKALVSFLDGLNSRPRYIIAKGGITSSDMAVKSLRMKVATVVGQAAPGIPLWECLEESSRWAGIPYIVFPGNVGSVDTLFQVVDGWRP